jgi:hypothetical protein
MAGGGHLWPQHFHSFLLDQCYLLAAARYIENDPVRVDGDENPRVVGG